jgi:hypothetical protein
MQAARERPRQAARLLASVLVSLRYDQAEKAAKICNYGNPGGGCKRLQLMFVMLQSAGKRRRPRPPPGIEKQVN